ncbi:dihydrofolate reductase family protein [Pararhizobium sp.]|uniref:dihydrofolate reductase family protein n=1 Tax=Pararhizobium sp. TaxID=1977563 RepID=UPI00272678DD|nr:dihydrofolate reductase family protein [Pararhizobium sp.]MDO9418647.1 dihydrofolate reductase family protein [Pararhizobium sp.]
MNEILVVVRSDMRSRKWFARYAITVLDAGFPEGDFDDLNNGIAHTFNRITKYVATHRPETLTWQNSQGLGTDIAATLRDLKGHDGPDLLIQGSSEMIQTLLANDLVDEFRLLIFPIIFGKGKRLFGDSAMPAGLRLTGSSTTENGIILANYERGGAIETGSFEMETPTQAELDRRANLT